MTQSNSCSNESFTDTYNFLEDLPNAEINTYKSPYSTPKFSCMLSPECNSRYVSPMLESPFKLDCQEDSNDLSQYITPERGPKRSLNFPSSPPAKIIRTETKTDCYSFREIDFENIKAEYTCSIRLSPRAIKNFNKFVGYNKNH